MDSHSLSALADDLLGQARAATAGRAAKTIHGGQDRRLRQTVVALAASKEMAEHDSPGEATLMVLQGRILLKVNTEPWEGTAGDFVVIPRRRHALAALEDSVLMLTVVNEH
ncbi:cupin domain-containing protein [Tessaracoccus sp. OS52]|uniref:cupin domain-containing protein n=1 Tax=Tessaracoccus sp. OS52 TaxID=2886691 RepID=UPI001D12B0AD|nr:cupin domain-containing protein [Tessaracoccus sp. OS52]MCC2592611.1 cupin domain-containing protein [Tessaracoccus sp. OS52]